MKIERERFEIFKAKKGTDLEELRRGLKQGEEMIGEDDVYLISYYVYGKTPEVKLEKVVVGNMDKYQEMLMNFFEADIPMINEGSSNSLWIEPNGKN